MYKEIESIPEKAATNHWKLYGSSPYEQIVKQKII